MEKERIKEIKEEIRGLMPEYISQERESIQEAWVEKEFVQWKLDHSSERFFSFTTIDGEEKEIDLLKEKPNKTVLELGGDEKTQDLALNTRNYYIKPLLEELKQAEKNLTLFYGSRYGRQIAEYAEELINYFSECNTVKDVIRIIKMRHSVTLNPLSLKVFYQDNKQTIEKKKLLFLSKKQDFTIATDSGRLSILNELLVTWKEKFDREPSLSVSKEIRGVLEQARKEIKGDQLFLTVEGKIDIAATIHAQENVAQTLQRLPINLLIIGMVAAKGGINPARLIYELSSSYYRDKNGFNLINEGTTTTLPGEYIRNIEWETLKENNERWEKNNEQFQEAVVIEEVSPQINDKKQKLLELLRQSKTKPKEEKPEIKVRSKPLNASAKRQVLVKEMEERKKEKAKKIPQGRKI